MRPTKWAARLAVILFSSAFTLAACAASAMAAPSDSVMSLARLGEKLEASGTIQGYMKTVVKGSEISTIAVNVLSVADGIDRPSDGLILFESTGTVIDTYGGIVAGMSGSPIYVFEGAEPQVIGAVSYGDSFSLGGVGLATPIESMLRIKSKYSPTVAKLDHPVITSEGVIDRVAITNDATKLSGPARDGAAVVHPLATPLFVSGIPNNSRLFSRISKFAAKSGRQVMSVGRRSASIPTPGNTSFETTLEPGASMADHEARGDVQYFGYGTVTYTDSETVLAYGHPNSQRGNSGIYMSNAWIDGIMKNSAEPYKLGRLGALRGTITQDRGAGLMGVTGQFPAETTITAEATNVDEAETTSSAAFMPRHLLNTVPTGNDIDDYASQELPADCLYAAGGYLFDQDHTPGSAFTTTTVHVRNTDTDATHTITMPNCIDDEYDIPSALIWDAADAVASLQSLLADDVEHFEILDIDLKSRISTRRNYADVVGVTVPSAFHAGANRVNIQVLAHGIGATQTIPATITIPAGVSTTGYLSVTTPDSGDSAFPTGDSLQAMISAMLADSDSSSRGTIGDIVDSLNAQLPGNAFTVRYTPIATSSNDDEEDDEESPKAIVTTGTAQWELDGNAMASPVLLATYLEENVMDYDGFNFLEGEVMDGPDNVGTISLFARPAGGAESLMDTTTANAKTGEFGFGLYGLTRNTTLRLHVDGSEEEDYLPTDKTIIAYVKPSMRFKASAASVRTGRRITLSASVYPAQNAGARVRFEYYSKGRWRTIATKTLSHSNPAKASVSWKVLRGSHKVRVRFLGSAYNASSTSSSKTVKGR
jgi:hypothetical protein